MKNLKIISMVLLVCLIAQTAPLVAFGTGIQEPVLKDGAVYVDVTTHTGNSSANLGDKIAANGANYDIMLDGEKVGSFIFNKNDPYIEIILTSSVDVDILWNCASKYADCTLKGAGTYQIPQLLQDNGKTQSFNALWIIDVQPRNDLTPLDKFVGDYDGVYYHNDGTVELGMTLKVYKEDDNYYAIFKFYSPAENPTTQGFFKMDVTYNPDKDQYELYQKEWLLRPQSPTAIWLMIDLKGKLTDDGVFYETESDNGYYYYFSVSKISINYEEIEGQYKGTYTTTTTQEPMGLNLNVEQNQYGDYMAVFNYYNQQNPDVIIGSYRMQIMYSPTYDEYTLVGESWISEPSLAEFVHLDGSLNDNKFTGNTALGSRINTVGTFNLMRIVSDEIS